MAVTWKKLAYNADLTTHIGNTTTPHGAVSTATASKIVVRDASARARFAAPAAAGDALIKGTRVTLSELPTLTTDKFWKGVGGVPAEADVPVSLIFTELAGRQDKTLANANTWEDYDLSAIIGAGAKSALVSFTCLVTSATFGVRKNGSALTRTGLVFGLDTGSAHWAEVVLTECDAGRIIEIYGSSKTVCKFGILGYWS